MRVISMRLVFALAMCISVGNAQPIIESISPLGAQRGSAVRLVLTGEQLGQARLISEIPGDATSLSSRPSIAGEMKQSLAFLVEIGADASLGAYPVRVETPDGISNLLLFSVGAFPAMEEAESEASEDDEVPANDFPELAQAIETPVTINGRLRGAERDLYRFSAAAGEKLVLEVEARRIGSAIDPHLELLDAEGRPLARNADARGLGVDSRLEFEFSAAGDYLVAIHDERFSEQKSDFYRLTIADFDYADGVFPLGWRRGETVRAEWYGGNLAQPTASEVNLAGANASETWISMPNSPARLSFLVGDDPEVFEDALSDGGLPESTVVNGRILEVGEVDRYRLAVDAGESWAIELRSGDLAGSDLYGVLTVSNGDEILATAGRYAGDPSPYVISTTGQTSSYPFINLEVPPGIDALSISVEDLLQRGGPAHTYRLTARRQGTDFSAEIGEPFVNIPARGSAIVSVKIERRGYHGAVDLSIENPPEDIIVGGGHIPPTSILGNTRPRFAQGTLTLTAKPGAETSAMNLVVRARGVREDGSVIERRAEGPGLKIAVAGKGQDSLSASWLGYDLPTRIVPEPPAAVEFLTPQIVRLVRGGRQHIARWAVNTRGDAGIAKKIEIPRNAGGVRFRVDSEKSKATAGEFVMFPHERTDLGTVDYNLAVEIRSGGRTRTVYSAPLEIEVVDGFGLKPPENKLKIVAGQSGVWTGSIWRDPEFRQTVNVRAENLPVDVKCNEAELADAASRYELKCTVAEGVPAGEYEVEIQAESILSDEATTPYVAEAAKTRLTIAR